MKDISNKKSLKEYESTLTTWNKGKMGKYQLLKRLNKRAFDLSMRSIEK